LGENIPENIKLNIREFWNWMTADEPELDSSLDWTQDTRYVRKDLDKNGAAIVWIPKDIGEVMRQHAEGKDVALDLDDDYTPVYESDFYIGILGLNISALKRRRSLEESKLKPLKDYIDRTLEMVREQGSDATASREQFTILMKKKEKKLAFIRQQFGSGPSHLTGLSKARYEGEMRVVGNLDRQMSEVPTSNLEKMDWYENEDDMAVGVVTSVDVAFRLGQAQRRYKDKSKVFDRIDDSIKNSQKFISYWQDYKAATIKEKK